MTITELTNQEMRVHFAAPWTTADHRVFLKTKALPENVIDYRWQDDSYTLRAPARFAGMLGLECPKHEGDPLPMAEYLFPYQSWVVAMALAAKRFAMWEDCGLGKGPQALEFSRHVIARTGGRVLIMAPLAVCHQFTDEIAKFYGKMLPAAHIQDRDELMAWAKGDRPHLPLLGISNFEKLATGPINELRYLDGVILDEASILKNRHGVISKNICISTRGIEYKLACTATPAPNDTEEYATQSGFLETGGAHAGQAIIARFFQRKISKGGGREKWVLRPHAREAFYRFMAGWSIYLRKPSAYGFEDPFADVPEPEIVEMKLEATAEQESEARVYWQSYDPGSLIPQEKLGVTQRTKLSQIAKGFIYGVEKKSVRLIPSPKPKVVADLVRDALTAGRQSLVWTVFDAESDIIRDELTDAEGEIAVLNGKMSPDVRQMILDRFRHGEIRCLISKAALLGYGLNFQFCTRMIFSGFDDSFERFYQAVRRCYRYGSREQLKVYVPYIPGLENHVWENVLRKKSQWEVDTARQEEAYSRAAANLALLQGGVRPQ